MTSERRLRLWALVIEHAGGAPPRMKDVCAAMISAVGVDGAAVVVAVSAAARESIHASDAVAVELEEQTLILGEGPGVDALVGQVVLAADLTEPRWALRWPLFTPVACGAGVGAIFALPLQVGGIRLGVMDLYRARTGDLDRGQIADALVLADTACALLLDMAGHGSTAQSADGPEPPAGGHPVVHQATGMIIVQLGVTAAVALTRLRAHAYAYDRRLQDVAQDVVERRLRFEPNG